MSLYLCLFCLEHASFVLRATNMYICLSLSKQVVPSSEPKYQRFGCTIAERWGRYGLHLKYKMWEDSWDWLLGNQLNAAIAYGRSSFHYRVPSIEKF